MLIAVQASPRILEPHSCIFEISTSKMLDPHVSLILVTSRGVVQGRVSLGPTHEIMQIHWLRTCQTPADTVWPVCPPPEGSSSQTSTFLARRLRTMDCVTHPTRPSSRLASTTHQDEPKAAACAAKRQRTGVRQRRWQVPGGRTLGVSPERSPITLVRLAAHRE